MTLHQVCSWHGADVQRCPLLVCAVQRRRFPVGANPIRQPLQPEAIGAVMEVTKWLKPSISVSRIGDSASVQAATRVNAKQALYGLCQGGVSLGDRSAHLFSFVSFFVRSESPFLRPDLHLACRWRAQKLSRLAVAPTLSDKLRRCQATP